MKYCDNENCTDFIGGECKRGFENEFRSPKPISDIMAVPPNWGYIATCKKKPQIKKVVKKLQEQPKRNENVLERWERTWWLTIPSLCMSFV